VQIELGNPAAKMADGSASPPDGHNVTYISIPESGYDLDADLEATDPGRVAREILRAANTGGVTRLPGLEPVLVVLNAWPLHSAEDPTWVWSDDERMEAWLSRYFGCPAGRPADVEDTHWTRSGAPGVGPSPDPLAGATALKTNAGNDIQAWQMFGHAAVFGQSGTATATSATSLTGGTETPGGSHAADDAKGMMIVAGTSYGLVTTNTTGTSPVYTVDRWYKPGDPGGAAGSTPGATATYVLIAGGPPAWFMGLTATATAPGSGDTTLAGEITTVGGGLIRKICPLAHTAGTNTQTLTPVFTANGTDSLPVVVAKIGVSQSLTAGVNQLFQTLITPATATLSASGDQLTVTETVTM
jgi:hypothetical protein